LAIPTVPWRVNKHILRLAMKDRLPAAVLNRPKTPLAGDPALQLTRHASVRWLDSFEVNPQLRNFVNLDLRRSIADEQTPDGLWASLRVFALNYWLTNSQPIDRRATENQVNKNRRGILCKPQSPRLLNGEDAWNVNRKPTPKPKNTKTKSVITSRK
jgi:hypothetical protein